MNTLKIIYIILCSLNIFVQMTFFIECLRRGTKEFKVISNIQFCVILISVFMLYAINCQNIRIAEFFYSLYFVILFIILLVIFSLLIVLEDNTERKVERKSRYIFYCLSLIDLVLMIAKPDLFFSLEPVYNADVFYTWKIHFGKYFIFHQAMGYLFSLHLFIKFIAVSKKNQKIYRRKVIIFMLLFLLEQISNLIFSINLSNFRFDFTPVIYGIMSAYFFYYSAFTVPKAAQDNMLSVASETISDVVICFDNRGRCIYVNKSGREVYKDGKSDWINKYINSENDCINCEEKLEVNGELHTYKAEFKKIYDPKKIYSGAYILLHDVTLELKEISEEAYRAAHDELTGLANRSAFFSQCEELFRREPEKQRYLIASNIKNFKLINDLFGTQFGDNLLRRQADMFARADYPDCIKGRISGDKFAMLIAKENFKPELALKNTEFVRELGQNMSFPLTMQLGIYEVADPTEKAYTMYNKALLALKNSKEPSAMKSTISFYDTSLMNKLLYEQNVIGEFNHALVNKNFHIFIQAQVESEAEKCIGGEALVRWFDPDSLCRQPDEFISILEKSGLIYKLDYYVWEKSAQILCKWQKNGKKDFYISVNISVKDFYYADLYQVFTNLVEKYEIPPNMFNLELTESAVIDKNSSQKNIIKRLRDYGFNIEMDDFGSGYSSLNVLKEIEMDVLKIDMEFLHATENEERGKSIIHSVVKMSKALGMKVVAEGVETIEQKNFLKEIGVDIYQGYYFSKPIEINQFEEKYMGGAI